MTRRNPAVITVLNACFALICAGCATEKSSWSGPNWSPASVSVVVDRLADVVVQEYEDVIVMGLGSEYAQDEAAIHLYRHYCTLDDEASKERAFELLFIAADRGNPYARLELGRYYLKCDPPNLPTARYWLGLASKGGIAEADNLLDGLSAGGEGKRERPLASPQSPSPET